MEGKDLFCGKLHCVENTREYNEISSLVNMSVYRISELDGKIMLASVSESDSRVRDYKVAGSKVDGKFSKVLGELTVSFTKPSDCFSTAFGCDVYYTNRRGLIEMKENKTKPVDQDNFKPLMLMTLEAKTPEFDKTIDRMSEFLKTFKYSDKLNRADLKMNLQFLTDHKHSNLSYHKTELTKEKGDETLLKCANLNDRVFTDMTKIGVDVSRTLCDNRTDGGGWIVIQRRIKGDVNFTRTWNDYKNGFGSTSGDFWIGNDVISHLTDSGYNELRFDMKYKGKDYHDVYRGFKVENEAAKYKMSYTSFRGGNVVDWFSFHNGMKFTTIDSDNDKWSDGNCAVDYGSGGWWYRDCHRVNVNGEWASRVHMNGINWYGITDFTDSLDFVEMKLRRM
ncbi:fibrinogen beta chain-like [Physella acuta]|uniref:fibrinogen beta chain-like n=1 Tax=Physella acuta TaxID=109671 RepID=UPI0027DD3F5E|nr:fibrinogen beta chain-like [Physella acuta]